MAHQTLPFIADFAKDTATVKVSLSGLSDPTDSVKTRRVSFTHMQDLFRLEK
jgi:hypothetical protein